MASEFHDNLRSDTDREHEADEGFTSTMGAYEGVFGVRFIVALTFTESGDMDGLIETTEFTELFQVLVHLLVGDDRKSKVMREMTVFVLFQNGQCVLM